MLKLEESAKNTVFQEKESAKNTIFSNLESAKNQFLFILIFLYRNIFI